MNKAAMHLFGIFLGSAIGASCSTEEPYKKKPLSEPESTLSSVRLCAEEVNVRDGSLNVMDDVLISFGESLNITGESKESFIGGKSYIFKEIRLSDGRSGWIASDYLKQNCGLNTRSPSGTNSAVFDRPQDSTSKEKLWPSDSVISIRVEPGLAAMMDTIAYAEFRGSSETTSKDAYSTIFSYKKFYSFSGHPRTVYCSGVCSDAAGRYQMLSTSWDDIRSYAKSGQVDHIPQVKGQSLSDFSPINQDRAALVFFWYKYSYEQLKTMKYWDSYTLETVVRKLAKTWASLPWSPYGQGHISWSELQKFYWARYKAYAN